MASKYFAIKIYTSIYFCQFVIKYTFAPIPKNRNCLHFVVTIIQKQNRAKICLYKFSRDLISTHLGYTTERLFSSTYLLMPLLYRQRNDPQSEQ